MKHDVHISYSVHLDGSKEALIGLGTTCLLEWKRRLRAESIAGSFAEWTAVLPVDGNDDNDVKRSSILSSQNTREERNCLSTYEKQYDTLSSQITETL